MKTLLKLLPVFCTVFVMNVKAQPGGHYGHGPHAAPAPAPVGGYYAQQNYGQYNRYNNIYRRNVRMEINQSAAVIERAMAFSSWNDIYSPMLAKAIRHQQYAQQLYYWGDYAAAQNHAERAGFLANYALYYLQEPGYANGPGSAPNTYPDPYGDPHNPYYRQANPGNGGPLGQGKQQAAPFAPQSNGYPQNKQQVPAPQQQQQQMQANPSDQTLPASTKNDRELLKINPKALTID